MKKKQKKTTLGVTYGIQSQVGHSLDILSLDGAYLRSQQFFTIIKFLSFWIPVPMLLVN